MTHANTNLRIACRAATFSLALMSVMASAGCFEDDFFYPLTGNSSALLLSYSMVGAPRAFGSAIPDHARIVVSRGPVALYDSTVSFAAGSDEVRVRVELELEQQVETLDVVVELLEGTRLIARGGQPVRLEQGQTTVAPMLADPVHDNFSMSGDHACYLDAEGYAYCWGLNRLGELGIGTTVGASRPVRVLGGLEFISISVGNSQTCALTISGQAYCWGWRLGSSPASSSTVPEAFAPDLRFLQVSIGLQHGCAVTASGELYCWGSNTSGQLTATAPASTAVPIRIAPELRFDAISAGFGTTCALSAVDIYCWGTQLGGTVRLATPTRLTTGTSWRSLSLGIFHACALDSAGTAHCWGGQTGINYGQLGNGSMAASSTPVPVSGGLTFQSVSASNANSFLAGHSCGIAGNGQAHCWGLNRFGQLGNNASTSTCQFGGVSSIWGSMTCSTTPLPVVGGHRFTVITTGNENSCALSEAGQIYCWGAGVFGTLGQGSSVDHTVPVRVGLPTEVPAIADMTLSLDRTNLTAGDSARAVVNLVDQNGLYVPATFGWSTSDSTRVQLDYIRSVQGPFTRLVLRARASGTATITVSTQGRSASAMVTVN